MKYLGLLVIRLYWLTPKKWRRPCIFKTSCSAHVYDALKNGGLMHGSKAFLKRVKQCRPGYTIYTTGDNKDWVILADKSVVERSLTAL
jgi:putative component of membrane protein insertase Oxa1/YidC/SpoIIIJ protein YidD